MDDHHDSTFMTTLGAVALAQTARPFTIYGIIGSSPFIGWGMELGNDCGALYWDPGNNSTHHADSAEQVLRLHQLIGDAHLAWFDES